MARTKQGGRRLVSARPPRTAQVASPAKTPASSTPPSSSSSNKKKALTLSDKLAEAQKREADLQKKVAELEAVADAARLKAQAEVELALQKRLRQLEAEQAAKTSGFTLAPPPSPSASSTDASMDDSGSSIASAASSSAAASAASSPNPSRCPSPASIKNNNKNNNIAAVPAPSVPDALLPEHWPSNQPHHVTLQALSPDSDDWKMIERKLHSTTMVASCTILSIQRVHNRPLWDRYVFARERLMNKRGNESLNTPASMGNEQLLWHGTRHNPPHLIYANADGFDQRMAGQGMLGSGLYFSENSGYSGTSYAHSLGTPQWGPQQGKPYKSAVPPLFTTTAAGKLKAQKIPKNSWQMFLARVCLGTSFDPQKMGRPTMGYYNRPPLRPFTCGGCNKEVDLEKLNIEALKSTLGGAIGPNGEIEEEEDPLGDTVPATPSATKGKRKRGSKAAPAPAPVPAPVAAAAAAPAAAAAAAPAPTAPAATPVVASAAAPVFTPRKSPRRRTPTARASISALPSTPSPAAALPQLAAVAATAAPLPMALLAPAAAPAAMATSSAVESGVESPSSAAAAAASSSSPACCSFDEQPVHCPKCHTHLGSRGELLAHPYRYDSVVNGHMKVIYESAAAYPEFLITYSM